MKDRVKVGSVRSQISSGPQLRCVARGCNSPKNKGKLGIFAPPRPSTNMPTRCPYILMPRPSAAAPVVSITLEYMGMVLAYSCLALEAQIFQAYLILWGMGSLSHHLGIPLKSKILSKNKNSQNWACFVGKLFVGLVRTTLKHPMPVNCEFN